MLRKKYYDKVQELKGNIRVLCRIRPLNKSEKERVSHGVIIPLVHHSLLVKQTVESLTWNYCCDTVIQIENFKCVSLCVMQF